jgi:hypothetical protein
MNTDKGKNMVVITISLFRGKIIEDRIKICEAIRKVLKSAFKIDHNNIHFRINEYAESEMVIPPWSSKHYLIIEIDLMPGKSKSEKDIFYKNIRNELYALNINDNDILVMLREPIIENWCINGENFKGG